MGLPLEDCLGASARQSEMWPRGAWNLWGLDRLTPPVACWQTVLSVQGREGMKCSVNRRNSLPHEDRNDSWAVGGF